MSSVNTCTDPTPVTIRGLQSKSRPELEKQLGGLLGLGSNDPEQAAKLHLKYTQSGSPIFQKADKTPFVEGKITIGDNIIPRRAEFDKAGQMSKLVLGGTLLPAGAARELTPRIVRAINDNAGHTGVNGFYYERNENIISIHKVNAVPTGDRKHFSESHSVVSKVRVTEKGGACEVKDLALPAKHKSLVLGFGQTADIQPSLQVKGGSTELHLKKPTAEHKLSRIETKKD